MAEQTEAKTKIVAFTFKKFNKKSFASRKRRDSNEEKRSSEEEEDSQVVRNEKRRKFGKPLLQKSAPGSLKPAQVEGCSDDSSGEEGVSKVGVAYKSRGATAQDGPRDQGATAIIETETELTKDAQAIFERSLAINKELKGKEDDKIYRGLNNYAQYYEKRDTAQGNAASGSVRKGPIRAPANLRATVRWDYQPDICKDFKETGYCGFGDSCKFLHDRSDYKFGWQLEREMADGTYGEADEDPSKYEIDSDEEKLPFKCLICRESFKDPVVTKCKHYFCEKCALDHYKKTTRCSTCNVQTGGVFCPAREIILRMKGEAEQATRSQDHSDSDPQSD